MSPEKELEKVKKDLAKSRAEMAALQRKLQATLLKKNGKTATQSKPRGRAS